MFSPTRMYMSLEMFLRDGLVKVRLFCFVCFFAIVNAPRLNPFVKSVGGSRSARPLRGSWSCSRRGRALRDPLQALKTKIVMLVSIGINNQLPEYYTTLYNPIEADVACVGTIHPSSPTRLAPTDRLNCPQLWFKCPGLGDS